MAYTALKEMRIINKDRFGSDVGPFEPKLFIGENTNDLKSSALRFIHNRCQRLRFGKTSVIEEMVGNDLKGRSLKEKQIPFNMEKDIDRLCLERAIENFIDSGTSDDAYGVYYCYLEMFIGSYGKSKKMIELLSEFEMNGSSLLMKHRDHFSHSVYVFALGLAIYENSEWYRDTFKRFYHFEDENEAHNGFLEYWGLTSLFHDIGYPFELPFEQVESYFESCFEGSRKGKPYISYNDIDSFVNFPEEEQEYFEKQCGKRFDSLNDLFAYKLSEKIGPAYQISESKICQVLADKPTKPNTFGYFMDHAYFSAVRLYREMVSSNGINFINEPRLDALTAILLHNSLYKFAIASNYRESGKPAFEAELHPLAYLLMLCDELQCWDRTAYGRISRQEFHPMSADFDFSNGKIDVCYFYDIAELPAINKFNTAYQKWMEEGKNGKPPRLKEYSDMKGEKNKFTEDIEMIVNLKHLPLHVTTKEEPCTHKSKHTYLSISSFMHLYDFAVAINARRKYVGHEEDIVVDKINSQFDSLSLEYKMSGLGRAKSFGMYLNKIHCFYTDRPVDFRMLNEFTTEDLNTIAPLEHERWLVDHQNMGWSCNDLYETLASKNNLSESEKNALREQMRCHKLAVDGELNELIVNNHYENLSEEDKDKDSNAMNSMLKMLKLQEGARIYKLD